jgi:predicted PurR-regulated permease PerM
VARSLTAGVIVLAVFLVYTRIDDHVLNPVVMSRTVRVSPLLMLLPILVAGDR